MGRSTGDRDLGEELAAAFNKQAAELGQYRVIWRNVTLALWSDRTDEMIANYFGQSKTKAEIEGIVGRRIDWAALERAMGELLEAAKGFLSYVEGINPVHPAHMRLLRAVEAEERARAPETVVDEIIATVKAEWRATVGRFREVVEEAIIKEIDDPRNAAKSADFRDGLRVARVILNTQAEAIGAYPDPELVE